jgi:heme a synthase
MTSIADNAPHSLAAARSGAAELSAVRVWLFAIAGLVFAMVIVGGATRLTGSGLSITEWQPILGVIPPQSEAAWRQAFEKYQAIPEYKLVNHAMDLQAFKVIYWWEWTHRLLGRLIGFVFLLPFIYFLVRRSIPRPFIPHVAALFILGGAQGALGWFMVKSGLSDRVDVSQYRLAAHLALATAIAAYAFWLGLSIRHKDRPEPELNRAIPARLHALILSGLVYLQIIVGAFVAGLKAGHASNTWPLMNGEVIPAGLGAYSPWYLNLFENPLTAQFTHRMIAYFAAIGIAAFAIAVWRGRNTHAIRFPALALLLAVLCQIGFGVATIIYDVPLGFALAHQANAIIVFALALWTLRRAVDAPPIWP